MSSRTEEHPDRSATARRRRQRPLRRRESPSLHGNLKASPGPGPGFNRHHLFVFFCLFVLLSRNPDSSGGFTARPPPPSPSVVLQAGRAVTADVRTITGPCRRRAGTDHMFSRQHGCRSIPSPARLALSAANIFIHSQLKPSEI